MFADLETPPQFDPTLLNTFLSNKTFSITLNVSLSDLQLQHQGNTFTLRYRKQNEAGYININTPHLDLTEARILDSARRTTSMHHSRQEYRHTDDYNGPRQRLRIDPQIPSTNPPQYSLYDPHVERHRADNPAPQPTPSRTPEDQLDQSHE